MKKEDLRPVEYNTYDNMEMEQASTWAAGFFHGWEKNVYENGNEDTLAIIERLDGTMTKVSIQDMRFTDRP